MITVTQTRKQIGSDHVYDFGGPVEKTTAKALEQLIVSELGFGGKVTEIDFPSKIAVETGMLSKIDGTIFEGTEEEMKPLFEATYFFCKATAEHSDEIVNSAVETLNDRLGELAGIPLFLSLAGPMVMGEQVSKAALMLGMGITAEEDIKKGIRLSTNDLVAAMELRKEYPGLSLDELVALAK